MHRFMGKASLLTATWDHRCSYLFVLAALNAVVSIYYYLDLLRPK